MDFLTRSRAAVLLAAYLCVLAAVVFQPAAGAAIGSVQWGSALMARLGVDAVVTPTVVEFVLNTALFVPLTFLAAFVVRELTWEQWFGLAMMGSGTIEFLQLMLLPGRNPSLLDLAANTLGGLLGALLARRVVESSDARGSASGAQPQAPAEPRSR